MSKPIKGAAAQLEKVEVSSQAELWDWLADNHGQQDSIWLVTFKKHKGEKYLSRDQVLDALIAYGWIDGRRAVVDEDRTSQLLSPRKQQAWAQSYKDRAAKLIEQDRMQPAGLAAIEASKKAGLWEATKAIDTLEVPDDVQQALAAEPAALTWFENSAPSYRRNILRHIFGAKKPETRAKRIAVLVEHCMAGKKVPQF